MIRAGRIGKRRQGEMTKTRRMVKKIREQGGEIAGRRGSRQEIRRTEIRDKTREENGDDEKSKLMNSSVG